MISIGFCGAVLVEYEKESENVFGILILILTEILVESSPFLFPFWNFSLEKALSVLVQVQALELSRCH